MTADGGDGNGSRVRLRKIEPQKLADQLGLAIHIRHLPPGRSKWNKILSSFVPQNWRGKPLVSYQATHQLQGRSSVRRPSSNGSPQQPQRRV